ncbi:MAG: peptidylprolyl isomerase [Planctomycetaceae bacterium]
MPARWGISAVIVTATAAIGGCISAPLAPAPVAVAPAPAAVAPVAVAPAAPCTLGGFLGITPVCAAVGKDVQHKLAFFGQFFPFLEPKPPLLTLTDPANLASSVPAIAAAAEIKAEQDMAPQKIKALKYLATIGCGGCYAGVEDAFLAGLEDCTEEVRFEAVKAIYATAGSPCVHCNNKACCSPKIRKRLEELAFEGSPCPKEPSARVRRMARIALNACGAAAPLAPPPELPTEIIPEGPTELAPPPAPVPARESAPPPPPPPDPLATVSPSATGLTASARVASAMPTVSNIVPSFDASPEIKADLLAQETKLAAEVAPANDGTAVDTAVVSGSASIDETQVVTDEELQQYYATRLDRYRRPEAVRWESASALIERFVSPEEAELAMAYMRDRARGIDAAPPENFRPELITAHRHDWTQRAEIASPPVVAALFSENAGTVSEVLTDGKCLILVRVIERRPAETPPFAEIAGQIRADFLAERAEGPIRTVSREQTAEPSAGQTPEPPAAVEATPVEPGDVESSPVSSEAAAPSTTGEENASSVDESESTTTRMSRAVRVRHAQQSAEE